MCRRRYCQRGTPSPRARILSLPQYSLNNKFDVEIAANSDDASTQTPAPLELCLCDSFFVQRCGHGVRLLVPASALDRPTIWHCFRFQHQTK